MDIYTVFILYYCHNFLDSCTDICSSDNIDNVDVDPVTTLLLEELIAKEESELQAKLDEKKSNQDRYYCPVCTKSYDHKVAAYDIDTGEQICSICGAVVATQRDNDFFTNDSYTDIYSNMVDTTMMEDKSNFIMGHESKTFGSRRSGLSGIGNNIITSYTKAMDFSSSGIMSSVIDKENLDYMGKKIKDVKTTNRMRYINNIITPDNKNPNEKNVKQVVMLIKQIGSKKNLPLYIQENVINLYREIIEKNKQKRLQCKIATFWCLYYTLRKNNLVPSLPEFLDGLIYHGFLDEKSRKVIQKKINKYQTFLLDLMQFEPIHHSGFKDNVVFLCNKFHLHEKIKRDSLRLGDDIYNYGGFIVYQGRSPKTVATILISTTIINNSSREECDKFLDKLNVNYIILRKVISEMIDIIKKNQGNQPRTNELSDIIKSLVNL